MIHWHSNVDAARQPTDPVPLVDLPALAPTLQQGADGIWYPPRHSSLDYPDQGNAFCFQVEDHSFWFRYRNRVLVEMARRFPPPGAIFDIGGGNGFVTRGLRDAGRKCASSSVAHTTGASPRAAALAAPVGPGSTTTAGKPASRSPRVTKPLPPPMSKIAPGGGKRRAISTSTRLR
jgi:hypothetical protein